MTRYGDGEEEGGRRELTSVFNGGTESERLKTPAIDDASFFSVGFKFPELEDENLKHSFPLVGDQMLKLRKFRNSVKSLLSEKKAKR